MIHGPKAFFHAITYGTDITDVSRKFDALVKVKPVIVCAAPNDPLCIVSDLSEILL